MRWAVALGMAVAIAGGCTVDEAAPVKGVVTTTAPPVEDLPQLPPIPAEQIADALRRATEARDVCGVIAAMESGVPDSADPDAVVEAYRALSDALAAGRSFRPVSLEKPWEQLAEGVDAAIVELSASGGRADAPSVMAVLSGDAMQQAVAVIERWTESPADPANPAGPPNCP